MQRSRQLDCFAGRHRGGVCFALSGRHGRRMPRSKEIQNLLDFQCNAAKTLKQAEANYADMARGYTDAHPVMICLKKKIEELKAAGK